MKDPNLMILAGGISSRMKRSLERRGDIEPQLKSDAQSKSKALIAMGQSRRPFLDYLLYNARESGYEDVVIVVSEKDTAMRDFYGKKERDNAFKGLRISYATQQIPEGRTKPLGTADAVLQGLRLRKDWRGLTFTVCNSDNLYSRRALRLLLESPHRNAMIDYDRNALGFDPSRVSQYSVTKKDKDGFLLDILEKPTEEEVEAARRTDGSIGVSMNIFRLDTDQIEPFIKSVPFHPVRQEKELPTAVSMMIQQYPKSMFAYHLAELVPDMTSIDDVGNVEAFIEREFGQLDW